MCSCSKIEEAVFNILSILTPPEQVDVFMVRDDTSGEVGKVTKGKQFTYCD